mgnify:CR=1 FL=1
MELCKSKYIIFDFDGVIVDSEREYYKAWKDASIYYGYELPVYQPSEYLRL